MSIDKMFVILLILSLSSISLSSFLKLKTKDTCTCSFENMITRVMKSGNLYFTLTGNSASWNNSEETSDAYNASNPLLPGFEMGLLSARGSSENGGGTLVVKNLPLYTKIHAWCAAHPDDQDPWVNIGGPTYHKFYKISTAGRNDAAQWTTTYEVEFTLDGTIWKDIPGASNSFTGNTDQNTPVTHDFEVPFVALAIRIRPKAFHGYPCIKVEVWVTRADTPTEYLNVEIPAIASGIGKLRASSEHDVDHGVEKSLLDYEFLLKGSASWCVKVGTQEWIEVFAGIPKTWTKLVTQGRHFWYNSSYVQTYQVKYSMDGLTWKNYGGVLTGNSDNDTKVTHVLSPPIKALKVRLYPLSNVGHMCLRWEVYFKNQ
jgi:hypothetical protein